MPADADVVSMDTTEIRWFGTGPVPLALRDWFVGSISVSERRRDVYLVDDRHDVGVKHRGGTVLELKIRRSTGPPVELAPALTGRLEVWRKWSPADHLVPSTGTELWVEVDKLIVKRRFVDDGTEVPFSPDRAEGSGCDVEIAAITVAGADAYTIAFAAFGPPDRGPTAVQTAWRCLTLETGAPIDQHRLIGQSMGYPEWLATVIRPGPTTSHNGFDDRGARVDDAQEPKDP